MARDRLTYKQRDLKAAIKAMQEAGLSIARVDVRKDGVTIIPGEPESGTPADADKARDEAMIEKVIRRNEKAQA